jgi:hypothetical protein
MMARVFTPTTIAEIVRRASAGAGARAIASELGLKVSSLRVKCSQLGISLRQCRMNAAAANGQRQHVPTTSRQALHAQPAMKLVHSSARAVAAPAKMRVGHVTAETASANVPLIVVVPRIAMLQLRQCGMSKGFTVERLAAELLTIIAQEGLCRAILDDEAS